MKKLKIYQSDDIYGTAFIKDNKVIAYVHENDGQWRDEYFKPILQAFGIESKVIEKLSPAQRRQVEKMGDF